MQGSKKQILKKTALARHEVSSDAEKRKHPVWLCKASAIKYTHMWYCMMENTHL